LSGAQGDGAGSRTVSCIRLKSDLGPPSLTFLRFCAVEWKFYETVACLSAVWPTFEGAGGGAKVIIYWAARIYVRFMGAN